MADLQGQQRLRLSQVEIERMAAAEAIIRECRCELAARDSDIVREVTAGTRKASEWRHYPDGDVYDPNSHAQYFYHTHSATGGRPVREHGHFHTFLRAEGMPVGVTPLLLPEVAVPDFRLLPPQAAPLKLSAREEVSHLVAIAIDEGGEPIRLFTTNRWVTGETWYRAADVIQMLDRFTICQTAPSGVLNRWVGALIQLFRPQITELLQARDETVMAWRRRRRTQVFEDPRLEVTSSIEIGLEAQFALLERVRASAIRRVRRQLPPMGEGWGEGHAG